VALSDPSGFAPPTAKELQAIRDEVAATRSQAIDTAEQMLHEAQQDFRRAESVYSSVRDSSDEVREKAAAHYRAAEMNYGAAQDRLALVRDVGFLPGDQVAQLNSIKLSAMEGARSVSENAAIAAANYDPEADEWENLKQLGRDLGKGAMDYYGVTDALEAGKAGKVLVEDPDLGTLANFWEKSAPLITVLAGIVLPGPRGPKKGPPAPKTRPSPEASIRLSDGEFEHAARALAGGEKGRLPLSKPRDSGVTDVEIDSISGDTLVQIKRVTSPDAAFGPNMQTQIRMTVDAAQVSGYTKIKYIVAEETPDEFVQEILNMPLPDGIQLSVQRISAHR
jgi:hypothetical protein